MLQVSLLGEQAITDPASGEVRTRSSRAIALIAFLVVHAGRTADPAAAFPALLAGFDRSPRRSRTCAASFIICGRCSATSQVWS